MITADLSAQADTPASPPVEPAEGFPARAPLAAFQALAAVVAGHDAPAGALRRAAALAACGCGGAVGVITLGTELDFTSQEPLPERYAALLDRGPRGPLAWALAAGSDPVRGSLDDVPWAAAAVAPGTPHAGALIVAGTAGDSEPDGASLAAFAAFVAPLLQRACADENAGRPARGVDVDALLNSMSDPVALVDAVGCIEVGNAACLALLREAGVQHGADRSLDDLLPRDRLGRAVKPGDGLLDRVRAGRIVRTERILRLADGRDRVFAVTGSPLRGAGGTVTGAAVVLRDISDGIARERALRLMQEIRRGLSLSGDLRQAARLVCRRAVSLLDWVEMAAIFTVEGGAAAFVAQAGFPARAARLLATVPLGPQYAALLTTESEDTAVFQTDRDEPTSEAARRLIAAAGAATFVNLPLAAGAQRFGVLTLASHAPRTPSRDELGLLEALAAQVGAELEGVRRREQAEAERARLQAVVDQLPEGVLLFDAAGRLTLSNRSAEEIIGARIEPGEMLPGFAARHGFAHADGRDYRYGDDPVARTFSTGRAVLGEEQLVRRARGGEVPVVANVAPVRDPDGGLAAVIKVFQDITSLREMDRQKDEFLSIAGHELRTPLTSIHGLAQLLHRRFDRLDRAAILSALKTITNQTEQMAALIDELLDVSRIRAGRLALEFGRCDVVPLARAAVERVDAQRRGSVTLEAPDQAPVYADRRRLQQVIDNILDNAAKYSDPRTPIAAAVALDDDAVRIRVRDRGIGVPPEAIGRLFERFYRAENAEAQAGGLGLGLYLCQEIVERHQGGIDVRSALGEGTEFTVRLPRYVEEG